MFDYQSPHDEDGDQMTPLVILQLILDAIKLAPVIIDLIQKLVNMAKENPEQAEKTVKAMLEIIDLSQRMGMK